jgi:hypothetical protein
MAELDSELADHVQRSVEAIIAFHRGHARGASPLQRRTPNPGEARS